MTAASMSASPSGAVVGVGLPARVGGGDRFLQRRTADARAASQAHDDVEAAVKIDDSAAAGALVQAVDVLRHEVEECSGRLPGGKGAMRGIRCGGRARRGHPT